MSREIAERCDLCGEYRRHDELVTVHALGEPVDVCAGCQGRPVADVLAAAQRHQAAPPAPAPPGELE